MDEETKQTYLDYGVDVSDMTQEEIDQLIALGIIPPQIEQAQGDVAYAEELMGSAMPQGRTTRNNIFTAANPLELAATGVDRVRGAYERKQARDLIDALRKQQTEGRGTFYNAYSGRGAM